LDRITGKTLLLRPEQGFELRGSADAIVKLCTAKLTVAEIIDQLFARVGSSTSENTGDPTTDTTADQGAEPRRAIGRAHIAEDVTRLLADLARRGLIVVGDEP
jgi:hypothetical protein